MNKEITLESILGPGDRIADRYVLVRELGSGGMGTVFLGEDQKLIREVAVKLLRPNMAAEELTRNRFIREARVTANMDDPGIVKIFDFGQDGDVFYLVMELVKGETLLERLQRENPPPLSVALKILSGITSALVHAHGMNLVHRDLKPENIFLSVGDDELQTKLVDFGLAYIGDRQDMGRVTRDGLVSGTPEYLAPEVARGEEPRLPVDIYALGILAYQLLTGRLPFEGAMGEIISGHLYLSPERPRTLNPAIHSHLDELIMKMLSKVPASRPRAIDLLEHFQAHLNEKPGERSLDHFTKDKEVSGRAGRVLSLDAFSDAPDAKDSMPTLQSASNASLVTEVTHLRIYTMGTFPVAFRHQCQRSAIQCLDFEEDADDNSIVLSAGVPFDRVQELCSRFHVLVVLDPSSEASTSDWLRAGVVDLIPSIDPPMEATQQILDFARSEGLLVT